MIDLTDILIRAQEHCLWSKQALSVLIRQTPVLSFDWDMECGERWASIELYGNFIGYISSFIPLCFCKTGFWKTKRYLYIICFYKIFILCGYPAY